MRFFTYMCFFHERARLEALEKKKINLATSPFFSRILFTLECKKKRSYFKTANYLICPTMSVSD